MGSQRTPGFGASHVQGNEQVCSKSQSLLEDLCWNCRLAKCPMLIKIFNEISCCGILDFLIYLENEDIIEFNIH